jgi:hypothetical protein
MCRNGSILTAAVVLNRRALVDTTIKEIFTLNAKTRNDSVTRQT